MDVPLIDSSQTWKGNVGLLSPIQYQNWQALQIFSLFRFVLAATFVAATTFNLGLNFTSQNNKFWFTTIAHAYLALSVLELVGCIIKKIDYDLQTNVPIFFDILAITLLTHMSGGLNNGLCLLLVVIVAAHSLLAPTLLALCGAAIASSAILTEQVFIHLTHSKIPAAYTQAGLLGLSIFVTALVANWLKHRMQAMHELAYQRGLKLASALQLNSSVVAFMQEGVIVFDHQMRVQLFNSAALRLLGISIEHTMKHLDDLPEKFKESYKKTSEYGNDYTFQIHENSPEIRLSTLTLKPLGQTEQGHVVFIHDVSKEAQKAQHMKLAALGTLAANIAHEIRNPLSSVSHSAQLLAESTHLMDSDHNLVRIIKDNCDRMNMVIKNVLTLSKKQPSHPELINLNFYLAWFIDELHPIGLQPLQIAFECPDKPLYVYIDGSQLHQMLINLCENGLRYSLRQTDVPRLTLQLLENVQTSRIEIHIIDYGEGVNQQQIKHLFEPFFTTEGSGSGLGLYITKELCEMNGGEIRYQKATTGGSDFMIILPKHQETMHYGSA